MTLALRDNASSTAQRRQDEQFTQALKDAQDAVEQALCDADLRIARTRLDAFKVFQADPAILFPGAFPHWKRDTPFPARILLRVATLLFDI
jgi:hypothetical protein